MEVKREDNLKKKPAKSNAPVLIALLLIIAGVVFALYPSFNSGVAATVNGEQILQADIDKAFNELPEEYQSIITKEVLLNQSINRMLVRQEAERQGLEASEEELANELLLLQAQLGVSPEQFDEYLQSSGSSMDDIRDGLRESILFNKLLASTEYASLTVSEAELANTYVANEASFIQPAGKEVSHILICYAGAQQCSSDRSREDALNIVEVVQGRLDAGTQFAFLARKYSDGPSAENGGALGRVHENTPFIPEFLEVALSLNKGQISEPLETMFGFHIITVTGVVEEEKVEFEDARAQVEALALQQKRLAFVDDLIQGLREDAEIKQ